MKYRKPLLISITIAALTALLLWGVQQLYPLPFVKVSAFRAVPKYSAVLFSPISFQSQTSPWEAWELAGSWELLGRIEAALTDSADYKRALAVMQPTGQGRMGWLAIWEMNGNQDILQRWLAKNPGEASSFKKVWIYSGKTPEGEPFSIAQFRNLVLAAPFPFLIEDAVRQVKTVGYDRVRLPKQGGPLFLQPSQISQQWTSALSEQGRATWDLFRNWPGWAALAVSADSSGWEASGEWVLERDSSWLNMLLQAPPVAPDALFSILPEQIGAFVWMSPLPGAADPFPEPWWSGEWAGGLLPGYGSDARNPLFWVGNIKSQDALDAWMRDWDELSPQEYQTFEIRQFLSESMFPLPWSDTPMPMRNPYAVQIESYLVFADSRPALEVWLDQYIAGQTLGRAESFLTTRIALPREATAWAFAQGERMGKVLEKSFQPPQTLPFFQRGGLQWALIPAEGRLRIEAVKKEGAPVSPVAIAWKANLEDDALISPQRVGDAWIVQDAKNQLYRIAAGGRIDWKRPLGARVLSTIFPIAYYAETPDELLFNTAEAIYLLDQEGQLASTFPLRLQSQATNGLLLTDFSGEGDYGIFLACENGRIYGYDRYGQPLEGWNPGPEVGRVIHPLQHFQHDQKDYIIAYSQDGMLHAFQRDGSYRFRPQKVEGQPLSAPDYEVLPTGVRIAVGDGKGQTLAVNGQGASFALLTPAGANEWVSFNFADVVGDERKDYISLSGNEVAVYYYEGEKFQLWKKMMHKHPQDELVTGVVEGEKKAFIGTVDAERRQISLWTPEGKLHPGFPLAGASAFSIARIPEGRLLVVALDGDVYAYLLNEER